MALRRVASLALARALSGPAAPPAGLNWRESSCKAAEHVERTRARLRVCVVGAGPAGFYAVDKLLRAVDRGVAPADTRIAVVDALPHPGGLVRSGVAPDHPEVKVATHKADAVLADPRVEFIGNVRVGGSGKGEIHIRRDLLGQNSVCGFHAVIVATGAAEDDRKLGVPGEEDKLAARGEPGPRQVLSAREISSWYNGRPGADALAPLLSPAPSGTAVVIGAGNVALDVGRVLLKGRSGLLDGTDAPGYALDALRGSNIRRVLIVARKGPTHVKITPKELREVLALAETSGIRVRTLDSDFAFVTPEDEENAAQRSRAQSRTFALLRDKAERIGEAMARAPGVDAAASNDELCFFFHRKPVAIERDESGSVKGIQLSWTGASPGSRENEFVPADLVVRSVGYLGQALPGVPFDTNGGVVPTSGGRILTATGGVPVPGLYAAGWIKRGPTGIIATNVECAAETVSSLLADVRTLLPEEEGQGPDSISTLRALLAERAIQVVDFDGWQRVQAEEARRGALQGRPADKLTDLEAILRVASPAQETL